MIVKINGHEFDRSQWSVNKEQAKFTFETDMPMSELEQIFAPEVATDIEVYNDDHELVERWFNRNLSEFNYKKQEDGTWRTEAYFKVSAINDETEGEIRQDIEDSDDAIFDLAEIISGLDEDNEENKRVIASHTNIISRISGLYDNLADRVARLENK